MNDTPKTAHPLGRILKLPAIVFGIGLLIFGGTSADRLLSHSNDNHYVYLADAMLHGRLHIEGRPPHLNDWAKYGEKWYVSFPPAPAFFMIPGVAVFGMAFNDRIFTLLFAAIAPALLLLFLMLLKRRGTLESRSLTELLVLSGLYGVGTVYYFAAAQGSVWYTAHMVGSVFLISFMLASLEGKHPLIAGLCLGIAFACRPPMLLAFPFFVFEMLRVTTSDDTGANSFWQAVGASIKSMGTKTLLRKAFLFAIPIAGIIGAIMVMNWLRFENPFEFGHKHLQVRWTGRIVKWGLFHYHYLSRNLTASLTLLPWISGVKPYIQISNHGLALWFTTPVLVYVLFPKHRTRLYTALILTTLTIAVFNLLYQNTGWVQFGYRFSLDYMPFLIVMIALTGRRFGKLFYALCIFAVVVNLFGAVTFDRMRQFSASRPTAYFQPD